jgi:AraC-like DNA-binding protein
MPKPALEQQFSDSDEAAAAIRAGEIDFCPLASPSTSWKVGCVDLGGPALWWGRIAARSAAFGWARPESPLLVMADTDAAGWTINRKPLAQREAALIPASAEYGYSFASPGSWWMLSRLEPAVEEQVQRGGGVGRDAVSTIQLPGTETALRRAFHVVRSFALQHGEVLDDANQETLRHALSDVLSSAFDHGIAPAERHDPRLLRRVLAYLHRRRGEPVFQQEICRDVGTTPRALRWLFADAFGATPGVYLRRRRMVLARRALASGAEASVTQAAVRFGFFDLGRFAGAYRSMFGELPSETVIARRGRPH